MKPAQDWEIQNLKLPVCLTSLLKGKCYYKKKPEKLSLENLEVSSHFRGSIKLLHEKCPRLCEEETQWFFIPCFSRGLDINFTHPPHSDHLTFEIGSQMQ